MVIDTESHRKRRAYGLLYRAKPDVKQRMAVWRNLPEQIKKRKAYRKKYYAKPEIKARKRKQARLRKAQIKLKVLKHYGGPIPRCKRCNLCDVRFLVLDHINGGGEEDRLKGGLRGAHYYDKLISLNYPGGLQVLCQHCNLIKERID